MNYNRYNTSNLAFDIKSKPRPKKKINKNKNLSFKAFIFSSGILVVVILIYIASLSVIKANDILIDKLGNRLEDILKKNEADEQYVKSQDEFSEIYKRATEYYGMKKPRTDQIIYYSTKNGDYFRQTSTLSR